MTTPYTILVADDDPTALLLMQASLERAGFNVVVAETGEQALAKFQTHHCQMAMLDVEMPDMSGYDVCTHLRLQLGEEFPIIMVTSMEDAESVERAFKVGATDFIAKPINWTLLAHRVKYVRRSSQSALDLTSAHDRHAAILRALPDLLLESDAMGTILDFHSPQFDASPAPSRSELIQANVISLLPKDAASICLAALEEANRTGIAKGYQFEFPGPSGTIWYELSVSRKNAEQGEAARFIVLARDITDRKQAEQRITELAYYDGLTMLPNRRSFMDRLAHEIGKAGNSGGRLAILFLDLDGFKSVNDSMGHDCGDKLLQLAATRLREGVRAQDIITRARDIPTMDVELARLGGDEFTALISDLAHADDALAVAQRIRELLAQPFIVDGRRISISSSIGISLYPDDGRTATDLVKHADTAMYHAKSEGRNNCQFYSTLLTRRAQRHLDLTNNLWSALKNQEFRLHYQPQMDLKTGRIESVEALIRWQHPHFGLIAPSEFIAAAEKNGLIVPIGEWVIRTACADAAQWYKSGRAVGVAINISSVQFNDPDLEPIISSALATTGLPAHLLELEITESTAMVEGTHTLDRLLALKSLGIKIALDDFGTGHSSFSVLKRLPIDHLKIDRGFVHGLPHDRDNLAIVSAILSLGEKFGLRVTAKGVETDAQAQLLREMRCGVIQGYLLSHPLPAEELCSAWDCLDFSIMPAEIRPVAPKLSLMSAGQRAV